MSRFSFFLLASLLWISGLRAQPRVEWIRSYGGEGTEEFRDIYETANGDFVLCGRSNSTSWIIRIDIEGNARWSRVYPVNPGSTCLNSLVETDDANILTAGYDNGLLNAIMVDDEGEQVWYCTYRRGTVKAVIELKSGEFILCGQAAEGEEWWGYASMLQNDGEPIWERTYDPGVGGTFEGMRETDGGIVMAGRHYPERIGFGEGWLVKIEPDGEIIWERSHLEGSWMDFRTITSVPGGGFALTGEFHDMQRIGAYTGFYILKVNERGEREWFETWVNDNAGNLCLSMISVNDQGFAAWGTTTYRKSAFVQKSIVFHRRARCFGTRCKKLKIRPNLFAAAFMRG